MIIRPSCLEEFDWPKVGEFEVANGDRVRIDYKYCFLTDPYVLIAIVKKKLQLDASLTTLLQILSVSVFEKTQLSCALQPDLEIQDIPSDANQLNWFNF